MSRSAVALRKRKRAGKKFSPGSLPLVKGGIVEVDYSEMSTVEEVWQGTVQYVELDALGRAVHAHVHVALWAQHDVAYSFSLVLPVDPKVRPP